jgi:hypothetical protein
MLRILRKVLDHPTGARVVAGVLVSAPVSAAIFMLGSELWDWMVGSHHLPGWAIILLSGASFAGFCALVRSAYTRWRGPRRPDYHKYIEDTIDGIRWRWGWSGVNRIVGLRRFCEECDLALVYQHENRGFGDVRTRVGCERCHKVVKEIAGGIWDLDGMAVRELERRVRSGEFRDSLERSGTRPPGTNDRATSRSS